MKITPLLAVRRDLGELEKRFETARESYEGLKAACEAQVSHWQWANGPLYDLDPLFFLDPHLKVGKISVSPPQNPGGWSAYGLAKDRPVIERQYTNLPNRKYYQNFYVYMEDRVLQCRFDYSTPHEVINCSQLVMGDSGPAYFQRWGSRGWFSYTFANTHGRIDSFVGVSKEPDEPERKFSGEILYQEDGIVELWTREPGRRNKTLSYRGKPPIHNPFVRFRE
jgi:hypothetical protein